MSRRRRVTNSEIQEAMGQAHGLRSAAAHRLGISPRTLSRRIAANPDLALSPEDRSRAQDLAVLMALYQKATSGNAHACITWLRMAGWGREVKLPVKLPTRSDSFPEFEVRLVTDQ